MNSNLDKIAKDLYGKIQTRFQNIKIGDENATVLSKKEDIPNARFFEFEYEEGGEPLGTIAITLDAEDGVVVQVSGDLVNDDDDTTHHGAYKFIRSFRQFAKDRLLNFDVQNIGKSNMDKRDYQFQAKRKEEPVMAQAPIMENKMYGNARMSYQDLGEARLVVKHSQPINLELAAGRTMHIENIYIENAVGERFRYPFKHLNGARALAEHIKAGGNPYDAIGKHICSLSEELASLRKFKGYVNRQEQLSEAMSNVTSRVMERIEEIKKTVQQLQRPAYYQAFAESFEAQEEQMLPEELVNDLIDRLTIRTFNEELKSVFPFIAKFVDESELPVLELGADDLLDETGNRPHGMTTDWHKRYQEHKRRHDDYVDQGDHANADRAAKTARMAAQEHHKETGKKIPGAEQFDVYENLDPESAFENFMDDIIREDKDEIFSPNKDAQNSAIDQLNKIMATELKGGPEGINAIESLKGLIDDPEFLNSLRDIDPDLDVRPLIQQYVTLADPSVATQLHFGGDGSEGGETEAPVAPPAPAPEAPPAPAPDATAMAAPPEAAPAPGAPAEMPAPAPVAEASDTVEKDEEGNVKSWRHEGDWKKADKKNPRGKVTNASGQALKKTLAMAKKAGATLETQLDFGHGVKTIAEIIDECGMTPQDVGYEQEGNGLEEMLKFVSGFYNKDEGNFPLGGMRVKIKVKKGFEDGQFGDAAEEDLMKILKFIDHKDPSGDEQHGILRLAGVRQPAPHDHAVDEAGEMPDFGAMMQQMQQHLGQMQNNPNAKVTQNNTSSGTINGQPASYNDAMSQANQMKFKMPKFGDDDTDDGDIDFNNPDDIGQRLQKKIGGAFNKMQGQVPNQNVQFPGGQMNPADMMKQIMQKINFGK